MSLRVLLVVFPMLWNLSSSLRCYICKPINMDYRIEPPCEYFNYSDKYVTSCAKSTMCYKKEISYSLLNGLKMYERGCAMQTTIDDLELTSHGWEDRNRIQEVYNEECKGTSKNTDSVISSLQCYCRGDLCNGAGMVKSGLIVLSVVLGLWIFGR